MNVPVALKRLWIQMTADRRRFGMFCAMLGVGLLLWARLIIITNTPRTVVADDQKSTAQAKPAPPSVEAPNPSRAPIQMMLSKTPQRDPFVISAEYFPNRNTASQNNANQGKFGLQPAEDLEQAELERLRRHVDRLKLEAVMTGVSLAVISGRTYRILDEVPVPGEDIRFRLVDVKDRSVILEYQDRRFERKIPSPDILGSN